MENYTVNRVVVDIKTVEPVPPAQLERIASSLSDTLRVVIADEYELPLLPDQDAKEELTAAGHHHSSSRYQSCMGCMQHADDRINGVVDE